MAERRAGLLLANGSAKNHLNQKLCATGSWIFPKNCTIKRKSPLGSFTTDQKIWTQWKVETLSMELHSLFLTSGVCIPSETDLKTTKTFKADHGTIRNKIKPLCQPYRLRGSVSPHADVAQSILSDISGVHGLPGHPQAERGFIINLHVPHSVSRTCTVKDGEGWTQTCHSIWQNDMKIIILAFHFLGSPGSNLCLTAFMLPSS